MGPGRDEGVGGACVDHNLTAIHVLREHNCPALVIVKRFRNLDSLTQRGLWRRLRVGTSRSWGNLDHIGRSGKRGKLAAGGALAGFRTILGVKAANPIAQFLERALDGRFGPAPASPRAAGRVTGAHSAQGAVGVVLVLKVGRGNAGNEVRSLGLGE